jgi:hypothetical protein
MIIPDTIYLPDGSLRKTQSLAIQILKTLFYLGVFMNIIAWLLGQITFSLCISFAVLTAIAQPLVTLLKSACTNGNTWRFWWIYTKVMVILVPILWVIGVDALFHSTDFEPALRRAFLAILTGQVLTLYLLGRRLGQLIPLALPTPPTRKESA